VRDVDHYVGRQDHHQDEGRHQGRLRQDHRRQDRQVERHQDRQGHRDEEQNQDVHLGHQGHQDEDHQDRQYEDHQGHRYAGRQDRDENQDQDVLQDQDGIHYDHQEAEVLVGQMQTLVREEVEQDEDLLLDLDHEVAFQLVACLWEACPLEDDLQLELVEREVVV
jgi:hypothetical protein